MELLDIVDENNNLTGEKLDRKAVHEKGLWHREISVFIMNEKNEMLVQKRASTKKFYPNTWSLCAGHIDAGEQPIKSAIRELEEEVGLVATENELISIGIQKTSKARDEVINNHFKYIYLIRTNNKLEDYKIQYEELSGLRYITIEELKKIMENKDENYTFSNSKYMLDFLENIDKHLI